MRMSRQMTSSPGKRNPGGFEQPGSSCPRGANDRRGCCRLELSVVSSRCAGLLEIGAGHFGEADGDFPPAPTGTRICFHSHWIKQTRPHNSAGATDEYVRTFEVSARRGNFRKHKIQCCRELCVRESQDAISAASSLLIDLGICSQVIKKDGGAFESPAPKSDIRMTNDLPSDHGIPCCSRPFNT